MPKSELFHILPSEHWQNAQAVGSYAPASLESEGFIHLSEARQLLTTAGRFYSGQRGLLVLRIRRDRLQAQLRYEPADGDEFPHLYGELNLDAVVEAVKFPPQADGTFKLPEPWRSQSFD